MATVEQTVGSRVRLARNLQGISQQELGNRLEPHLGRRWSRQAVSNAEAGGRDFAASELIALAMVLNVSIAWLFTSVEEDFVQLPGETRLATADLLALVQPPTTTNQREVGKALAMFHAEIGGHLEQAQGRLAAAGEYVKWLRADVESDTQEDDQ